jgi:hypothetical protein
MANLRPGGRSRSVHEAHVGLTYRPNWEATATDGTSVVALLTLVEAVGKVRDARVATGVRGRVKKVRGAPPAGS